jgi:hypothetical protein
VIITEDVAVVLEIAFECFNVIGQVRLNPLRDEIGPHTSSPNSLQELTSPDTTPRKD